MLCNTPSAKVTMKMHDTNDVPSVERLGCRCCGFKHVGRQTGQLREVGQLLQWTLRGVRTTNKWHCHNCPLHQGVSFPLFAMTTCRVLYVNTSSPPLMHPRDLAHSWFHCARARACVCDVM